MVVWWYFDHIQMLVFFCAERGC